MPLARNFCFVIRLFTKPSDALLLQPLKIALEEAALSRGREVLPIGEERGGIVLVETPNGEVDAALFEELRDAFAVLVGGHYGDVGTGLVLIAFGSHEPELERSIRSAKLFNIFHIAKFSMHFFLIIAPYPPLIESYRPKTKRRGRKT